MSPVRDDSARSTSSDWGKVGPRWTLVPSWLASALLHVSLAFALLTVSQWSSCRGDFGGDGGESFRVVGLRPRTAREVNESPEPDRPEDADENRQESPMADAIPEPLMPQEPPVPLSLPMASITRPPLLAAGLPGPVSQDSFDELIRPRTGASSPATGGPPDGGGGTSFLGVEDVGKRFVYVIDRSYSMADHAALAAAKQELLTSIERLSESQQFQVIFYHNEYSVLQPRNSYSDMFWGTEIQRLQVRQQIASISPAGGTNHFPAILRAFQFNPDVVFVLTDGTVENALSANEVKELTARNRGGARIHCIEFGEGPPLKLAGNFLENLAAQNHGKYAYRDVTTLRARR